MRGPNRSGSIAALVFAVAMCACETASRDETAESTLALTPEPTCPEGREPGPRPDFRMPFSCSTAWRLETRSNHGPEDMKIDFYSVVEPTRGRPVLASAAGTVSNVVRATGGPFSPASEFEIDHGNGWFSLYLHMDGIPDGLSIGTPVAAGQVIGNVSDIGSCSFYVPGTSICAVPGAAHLHYEQGYDCHDPIGEVDFGSPLERRHPVIQGVEYRLTGCNAPVVFSQNCAGIPAQPPGPVYSNMECVSDDEPDGSYRDSCVDSGLTEDKQVLEAACGDSLPDSEVFPEDQVHFTELAMPCHGDIVNCYGALQCGGCDAGVITGSFVDSCRDCSVEHRALECACRTAGGAERRSTLLVPCAQDVTNCDGRLTCGSCPRDGEVPPIPPAGCGAANPGEGLVRGQSLWSCNGRFELAMQTDGNLVLYRHGAGTRVATWATGTQDTASDHVIMQPDGNFVLYDSSAAARWASNTWGFERAYLRVQDDGNLVVYQSNGLAIWATGTVVLPRPTPPTTCGHAFAGQGLLPGQMLWSCDGRFYLKMEGNGNLTVYRHNVGPLWTSNATSSLARYSIMQPDGNLVVYDEFDRALWATSTWGHGGAYLRMQNDSNLVVYAASGAAIWASGTHVPPAPTPPTACGVFFPGQGLAAGQSLWSCDGRFRLWMQADGNLVLYRHGVRALWATATTSGREAIMQPDGNFVLYDASYNALWASNTWGFEGAYASVQNDGNFVVYEPNGIAIWATGTSGN